MGQGSPGEITTISEIKQQSARLLKTHRQLFREKVLLVEEQDDAGALEVGIAADALEEVHRLRHAEKPNQAAWPQGRQAAKQADSNKSGWPVQQ